MHILFWKAGYQKTYPNRSENTELFDRIFKQVTGKALHKQETEPETGFTQDRLVLQLLVDLLNEFLSMSDLLRVAADRKPVGGIRS